MGAIDQYWYVAGSSRGRESGGRQDSRRRGRDLVNDDQLGAPRSDRGGDRRDDVVVGRVEPQWDHGVRRPRTGAHVIDGERDRAVPVGRCDDLVAAAECQRAQDDAYRRRRVGDECSAGRVGAEELRQVRAGMAESVPEASRVELLWVCLDLVAQALLGALHRDRYGAERAVVQVSHRRIERKEQARPGQRGGRRRHDHDPNSF